MNMMNPAAVASARTARLVREATTPVYSTDTATAMSENMRRIISRAQDAACTDEYCFICKRATDHWGEHDDEQILRWANSRRGRYLMGA